MKRMALAVFAVLLAGTAFASDDDAAHRIEGSMVVTGWVQVATDGSVIRYTLDQQDKLPAPVVEVIQKTVPGWKFHPVMADGKPVVADAKMNLRVVALPQDKDQYIVHVSGASFSDGGMNGDKEKANDEGNMDPSYKSREAPHYPIEAIQSPTNGTVYLALEIDHAGHVVQAVATQVDLRAIRSEFDMRVLRRAFANASISAAKSWTFNVPQSGKFANKDDWTVFVPINFTINGSYVPQYGQWDVYVPGPVQPIPWEQDQIADGNNADAIPGDGVFTPDKRFALLTPLSD